LHKLVSRESGFEHPHAGLQLGRLLFSAYQFELPGGLQVHLQEVQGGKALAGDFIEHRHVGGAFVILAFRDLLLVLDRLDLVQTLSVHAVAHENADLGFVLVLVLAFLLEDLLALPHVPCGQIHRLPQHRVLPPVPAGADDACLDGPDGDSDVDGPVDLAEVLVEVLAALDGADGVVVLAERGQPETNDQCGPFVVHQEFVERPLLLVGDALDFLEDFVQMLRVALLQFNPERNEEGNHFAQLVHILVFIVVDVGDGSTRDLEFNVRTYTLQLFSLHLLLLNNILILCCQYL